LCPRGVRKIPVFGQGVEKIPILAEGVTEIFLLPSLLFKKWRGGGQDFDKVGFPSLILKKVGFPSFIFTRGDSHFFENKNSPTPSLFSNGIALTLF